MEISGLGFDERLSQMGDEEIMHPAPCQMAWGTLGQEKAQTKVILLHTESNLKLEGWVHTCKPTAAKAKASGFEAFLRYRVRHCFNRTNKEVGLERGGREKDEDDNEIEEREWGWGDNEEEG